VGSNSYVFWLCITTLSHWLKKLAPLFHPIRSDTKTNRDTFSRALRRLHELTSSFDCFIGLSVSSVNLLLWFFRRIMMRCNTKPKSYRYSENEDHFKGNDADRDQFLISCTLRLHCLKIRTDYKLNGPWMPSKS